MHDPTERVQCSLCKKFFSRVDFALHVCWKKTVYGSDTAYSDLLQATRKAIPSPEKIQGS